MKFFKLFIVLGLFVCGSNSYAWNWGVEADVFHPLLRSGERTQFDRTWVSPRLFIFDQFHFGGELIHDSGEVYGSASGTAIGGRTAPTKLRGLSFGYYHSGYLQNTFKLVLGAGPAEREFIDTLLGSSKTTGTFYLAEVGYQFVGTKGLLGLSFSQINSDLEETKSFSSGGNQSELRKGNSDSLFKLAVGVIF